MALHQRHFEQGVEVEQAGANAVVDVVIVISDIVSNRGDLRLQPGPAAKVEVEDRIGFGECPAGIAHRPIMLGQPFERFPAEIEPVEADVGRFEQRDEAQRLRIMVEPAPVGERRR